MDYVLISLSNSSEPKLAGDKRQCSKDRFLSMWNKNKERMEEYNSSIILKVEKKICLRESTVMGAEEKVRGATKELQKIDFWWFE